MQQGIPEGPESAASPAGPQPAVEAAAEVKQGGAKESVRVPRAHVRAPRPCQSFRGLDGDQEALLQEARREEVEMRQVLQEVRCSVRLEGALQSLRHQRV